MYTPEILGNDEDDGTMVTSRNELAAAVVGHRIVSATKREGPSGRYNGEFEIVLDSGEKVIVRGQSDCCAYTEIESFLLNADKVDHIITGIGTTGKFETWHIYADMGDVLQLNVSWSPGNPFYYAYGFTVEVVEPA